MFYNISTPKYDEYRWDIPTKINGSKISSSIETYTIKANTPPLNKLAIKKIIFNPPATIVYWNDGVKTVIKCADGDTYNKSAGIALCVMKRFCGENFHSELKRLLKEGKDYDDNSKDNNNKSNK